jgi:tyrosyl-tRNA synthetase
VTRLLPDLETQLQTLRRGVVRVVPEEDFIDRLRPRKPLRIKLGIDPTAPDIHLGHTVVLTKLSEFQALGHQVVLIIGDLTACIGDPSGRSATRPPLTHEEVTSHATTYLSQVFKILDRDRTEVRRNSEWLAALGLEDIIRIASRMTVARLLERDDFHRRLGDRVPIGLHELLYPLMQGYDSVVVRADVELGGTDQTFNLMVGRDLQRDAGLRGQVAMVLPLLEGTDGSHKMSKSLGNHIGVDEPPDEMYGKLMSIGDDLMLRYYELLVPGSDATRASVVEGRLHPMDAKKELARLLVSRFHGDVAAGQAAQFFERRFQRREAHRPEVVQIHTPEADIWICQLMREVGFAKSTSEARRLVAQGGVRVDRRPVDVNFRFQRGVHRLLEVGKRRLAEIEFAEPG